MMQHITAENINGKKLAQAYLICAASREAADRAALSAAKRILCQDGTGCGVCPGCRKFDSGNHMDFMEIRSEGAINKNLIDELPYFLSVKSFEGSYRVIYIENAHMMNPTVQNKLLKSFEDPPENTVFLLSSSSPEKLLPTVVSRCIRVNVNSDSPAGSGDVKMSIALKYTGGFADEARELLKDAEFFSARDTAINAAKRIVKGKIPVFAMAQELLTYNKRISDVFFALSGFFTDAAEYKLCGSEPRYTPDAKDDIADCTLSAAKLLRLASVVTEYSEKDELYTGVNDRLLVETMLFELSDVIRS